MTNWLESSHLTLNRMTLVRLNPYVKNYSSLKRLTRAMRQRA